MKIKQFGDSILVHKPKFLTKHRLILMGIFTGAIGGYLYYHFVGCAGGTCMITSRSLPGTIYGAIMGGLLFDMFRKSYSKSESNS